MASSISRFKHNWKSVGLYEVWTEEVQIKTKNEFIKIVTDIWQKIPLSYIRRLYDSITRRVKNVLRSKGAAIKY